MNPQERINWHTVEAAGYKAVLGLEMHLRKSGLDPKLKLLVVLRASQINHCAFCIDMHWKELRHLGESEQRLYLLSAWRESPGYSDRERAALAWTEAVTELRDGVPDDVYQLVCQHFDEKELTNLTLAIATINLWNRMGVAFQKEAGTFEVPAAATAR